ncbi:MAG: T9SS type A sorting domain-containing protein [Bacteroidetes bacterium]|nr:T9SS type A sorting domain-containing protein [Bacteroidota bacterium]
MNLINITCNGFNDGIIIITASGGTGALEDSIAGFPYQPDGTPFINISVGSYDVTVKDSNGCTLIGSTLTIPEPAAINALLILSTPDTNNVGVGTATFIISGGTSPYSYSWIPFAGNDSTAVNLMIGTYTVTVTDANGCIYVDSVYVDNINGISDNILKNNFHIYPNPSNDILTIKFESMNNTGIEIKISDLQGRVIFIDTIEKYSDHFQLDISKYKKGIYFIQMKTDKENISKKIFIE